MKAAHFVATFLFMIAVPLIANAKNSFSSQQCNAWFAKIDRNKDGSIGANENAASYYSRITLAGASNNSDDDFVMSKPFFIAECKIGSLGKPRS